VTITGVPRADKADANLQVRIFNCRHDPRRRTKLRGGFFGGLRVARARDVDVRANRLATRSCEFEDCVALTFDGNAVMRSMRFRQTKPGGFCRTRVTKCDFYGGPVVFEAPKAAKPDKVRLDKCWFDSITDPEKILQWRVWDCRRDNKACNVKVVLTRIHKRPLGIGGMLGY
jgi:hypothetical protein